MTDDDQPRYCSDHHWAAPTPRLVRNAAGELVDHPTERMRWCLFCSAEETVEREPR